MSSSKKTSKVSRGGANLPKKIQEDNVATQGWTTQSTGVPGDEQKTAFDMFPHDMGTDDTGKNEDLRDLLSLQPHFGGERLMGERHFEQEGKPVMKYLEDIRDKRVR